MAKKYYHGVSWLTLREMPMIEKHMTREETRRRRRDAIVESTAGIVILLFVCFAAGL